MVELLSRKVLTKAEEDELLEMVKPKNGEELLEPSQPQKPQTLSEKEVNEFMSMVKPDFQSLAKMRQEQKLRHLNITTKASDLVQADNTQDSGRVANTGVNNDREM